MPFTIKNKILFIGSFKLPQNGHFGGVYFASTSLRDKLLNEGYDIIELDTTLKDIRITKVSKRVPTIVARGFWFIFQLLVNIRARHLLVFLSSGGSYIDKFLPILLAKILKKKVTLLPVSGHLINHYEKKIYQLFINTVFQLSDYVICQSDFWCQYFQQKGVAVNNLIVIENWVAQDTIEKSKKISFKEKYIPEKETFTIIFVSRIEKDKGVLDIVDLAKSLKGEINFIIDVYGSGSFEEEFLKEIRNKNLQHVVSFKGWLNQSSMQKVINSYHLALFTSKTEGYPNIMLDYIFSKVPIIASDIPMVRAVGKNFVQYYRLGNIGEFMARVLFCINNYGIVVENSKNLYFQKCSNNNIDFAANKIIKILN